MQNYTIQDFMRANICVTDIRSIRSEETERWSRPHPFAREWEGLLWFESGTIEYYFESFRFTAGPGQVFKLPAGIPYWGKKLDDAPLRFTVVDFRTRNPGEFLRYPFPICFTPSDGAAVRGMLAQMEETWWTRSLCFKTDCISRLLRLLSELARDVAVNRCGFNDRSRVMLISDYIRENAHQPDLRVADIAEHFHMSATHLRRIFASKLGTSPAAALASVRMENARRMLMTEQDLSISEIARLCGYASVYYFSQSFRKSEGMSPSRFREKSRSEI